MVEKIKKIINKLKLPVLPPHIVSCENYRPDAATRVEHGYVIIEYVNSKDRFNWDIGGMFTLLVRKDIVDYGVVIVKEGLWDNLIYQIRKYQNDWCKDLNLVILIGLEEFKQWLKKQKEQSTLWKPENLIVCD